MAWTTLTVLRDRNAGLYLGGVRALGRRPVGSQGGSALLGRLGPTATMPRDPPSHTRRTTSGTRTFLRAMSPLPGSTWCSGFWRAPELSR